MFRPVKILNAGTNVPEIFRLPATAETAYHAGDALVLTSPSAVRLFFASCACDRRRLPAFYTCGAGTDAELRTFGVASDVMHVHDFSADGLIAEIRKRDLAGKRVLRLRSAKAGPAVARALRRAGAQVDDLGVRRRIVPRAVRRVEAAREGTLRDGPADPFRPTRAPRRQGPDVATVTRDNRRATTGPFCGTIRPRRLICLLLFLFET